MGCYQDIIKRERIMHVNHTMELWGRWWEMRMAVGNSIMFLYSSDSLFHSTCTVIMLSIHIKWNIILRLRVQRRFVYLFFILLSINLSIKTIIIPGRKITTTHGSMVQTLEGHPHPKKKRQKKRKKNITLYILNAWSYCYMMSHSIV